MLASCRLIDWTFPAVMIQTGLAGLPPRATARARAAPATTTAATPTLALAVRGRHHRTRRGRGPSLAQRPGWSWVIPGGEFLLISTIDPDSLASPSALAANTRELRLMSGYGGRPAAE